MGATTSAIIGTVSEVVTASAGWMSTIVNFITSNPLVTIFVTIGLVGLGVGLLRRVLGL